MEANNWNVICCRGVCKLKICKAGVLPRKAKLWFGSGCFLDTPNELQSNFTFDCCSTISRLLPGHSQVSGSAPPVKISINEMPLLLI